MPSKKEQKLIPIEDIPIVYEQCLAIDTSKPGEAQRRGYLLQDLMYSVLTHEGLEPRASYKPKGEEIDGSFYLSNTTYLLEAKWVQDPISASDLYSFKGKVDGKLAGTRGVFISMSGFSDDAPESLIRGKQLTSIMVDHSDMEVIFGGRATFKQVLDFKIRQAGETGKPYVPYQLPEKVISTITTIVTSEVSPRWGYITSTMSPDLGLGKAHVLLMCEGQTDASLLTPIFGRLLNLEHLKQEIVLEIIPMEGMQNWLKRLPEIVNVKLNALGGRLDGIVLVLDSDTKSDAELNQLKSEILRSMGKIAISAPLHVTFAKPDIHGWIGLDRGKYPKSRMVWMDIKELMDTIDIDHFVKNDPEMQVIAHFLNSLIEEEAPLWESDAIEAVKAALEEAEWDDVNNAVTLPSHEDKEPDKICRSLEELEYALVEIAVNGAANSMPFEGGEAVFDLDYDSIVQEILIDYYSEQIEELGWEL